MTRQQEDEVLSDVLRRMLLDPSSMVSLESRASRTSSELRVGMVSVDGVAVVTAEELEVVRRVAGRD